MQIDTFNFSYLKGKKNKFANIELDAFLSQSVTLENTISEHTLEDRSLLNDAIHNKPLTMSFTAVISDMPQSSIEQAKLIGNDINALFKSKSLPTSKSLRAWKELVSLWRSKTLVTISSPLQHEVFEDMAIKSISVNVQSTKSLEFSVNLKHIPIAENIKTFKVASEVGKQSKRP